MGLPEVSYSRSTPCETVAAVSTKLMTADHVLNSSKSRVIVNAEKSRNLAFWRDREVVTVAFVRENFIHRGFCSKRCLLEKL